MLLRKRIIEYCVDHYKLVTVLAVGITVLIGLLAALPSVYPAHFPFLNKISIDTDPENMLPADEAVRVFHNQMKQKFSLHDMVVVGVVNNADKDGVFNPVTLKDIVELTNYAKTLNWPVDSKTTDKTARKATDKATNNGADKGIIDKAVSDNDTPGNNVPNNNGIAGKELPGSGLPDNGLPGGGLPDNGLPGGGLPGNDLPSSGLPGGALPSSGTETNIAGDNNTHQNQPVKTEGVIVRDILSLSTVDNIKPDLGAIHMGWLMRQAPTTKKQSLAVRDNALRIPFMYDTLVSKDGKAVCLYLPITRKSLSYKVYAALKKKIATFKGPEKYYITGLPVAEDTFGVEMFRQMAISAPLAALVIFLLMFAFFRKIVVIISPMLVALMSVIFTMGLLIIFGFPIHIMSSMIPIFIMPIAVLDSIHIISEFFERYQATKDRRQTIIKVMDELFMPMLYTSLTSTAGFASLALTPIPPVQVFGIFVAMGIMWAWVLTIAFIPAYVMFIKPKTLEKFGVVHVEGQGVQLSPLGRFLHNMGYWTVRRAKSILAITCIVIAIAIYGISLIVINDNPIKWFSKGHPIRVADRILNQHFGGTYMAYLTFKAKDIKYTPKAFLNELNQQADKRSANIKADYPKAPRAFAEIKKLAVSLAPKAKSRKDILDQLAKIAQTKVDNAPNDDLYDAWDQVSLFLDQMRQQSQVFKNPTVLNYLSNLQKSMLSTGMVGKTNSLADIVKTVYRDMYEGKQKYYIVPNGSDKIAQCLIQYQSGHRPYDLWHFVTPDYRRVSIWVQLKSGDNRDMSKVVKYVNNYIAKHPLPAQLVPYGKWFGLTYINVIWQQRMVSGMLQAFLGSFLVVFILMTILFRSALWGFLSMVPLTITIAAIYGVVGLIGKDYDMPVAVLSSMSLGLAVDFAIHFLARGRVMYNHYGNWAKTVPQIFGEPARAITRNIIVIATGFLPLLLAPLVPYRTVGILLASILMVAGVATLLLLPALVTMLEKYLFAAKLSKMSLTCNFAASLASLIALVLTVVISIHQYGAAGWATLTIITLALVPVLAIICWLVSRRCKCRIIQGEDCKGKK